MKKLSTFLVLLMFLVAVAFSYPTASADTKFKVTSTVTSNSAMLKWNKLSGAKYYQVYRKTAKTKYKVVCKKTTNKSFTSKNLKSGTKYTFKVTAFKKNAKGKFYGFKSATVTATPKFKLTTSATQNKVTLKWNKADGAKYYKIYRKTADTSYKLVCKKTTSRTFVSKNLKANTKYTFKIKAYKKNKKGKFYSFKSATKTVKTKNNKQPQTTLVVSTEIPTTTTVATSETVVTEITTLATEPTTVQPTTEQLTPNDELPELSEHQGSLKSYFDGLNKYQLIQVIKRDFEYEIPCDSELMNIEYDIFRENLQGDNLKETWGYSAKFKLTKFGYEELSEYFADRQNMMEYILYLDPQEQDINYSWWNVKSEDVIFIDQMGGSTHIRFPGHTIEIYGMWNNSWLAQIDGEYYLYINTELSHFTSDWYKLKNSAS